MSHVVVTADVGLVGTVCGMAFSCDLTDEQWALLEPVWSQFQQRANGAHVHSQRE